MVFATVRCRITCGHAPCTANIKPTANFRQVMTAMVSRVKVVGRKACKLGLCSSVEERKNMWLRLGVFLLYSCCLQTTLANTTPASLFAAARYGTTSRRVAYNYRMPRIASNLIKYTFSIYIRCYLCKYAQELDR